MSLVSLARPGGPTSGEISLVLAARREDIDRPALAAALRALAPAESARVVAVEALEVAGKTAVDIEARLPGGGKALCSVQAARGPDGAWRVVWFETPSGSWPARRPGPGEGLTSSAPPR